MRFFFFQQCKIVKNDYSMLIKIILKSKRRKKRLLQDVRFFFFLPHCVNARLSYIMNVHLCIWSITLWMPGFYKTTE